VLVGVSFVMLSFDMTQSSPFIIELWITSGCTYLYLILLSRCFSFLEILPLKNLSSSIEWMEIHFVIEKNQFRGIFEICVPK